MKIIEFFTKTLIVILFTISFWIHYAEIPVWRTFLVKDFSIYEIANILQNSSQQEVAIILNNKGTQVKRKKNNENFYTSIGINDKIYNGDIIITDESTHTNVKFLDGSEMGIAPQSMVKIELYKKEDSINSIAKIPKVEVLQGNIDNKSIDIKIEPIKKNKIARSHLKKQVALEKINKTVFAEREIASKLEKINIPSVTEPPILDLEDSNKQDSEKIEIVSLKSIDQIKTNIAGRKISTNKYDPELKEFFVDISWNKVSEADFYEISFFKNQELFLKVKSLSNYYRLKEIFNGKITYSIEAIKNNKKISHNISKSLSFEFLAPTIKNPQNGSIISNQTQTLFTWSKQSFVDYYIVEIRNNKTSNIKKIKVKDNFISDSLPIGNFSWRVWAVNNETLSSEANWNDFIVEK